MREIHPPLQDIAEARHGLARLDEAVRHGAGRDAVRDDVLAGRAIRLHRGVYLVPGVRDDRKHVDIRAACLHLGPEACAVLSSAVAIHGIHGLMGSPVPQIAVPPGLEKRQRAGLDIHFWSIPEEHRTVIDGLVTTTAIRTVADVARLAPRMQAVACIDSALHLGLVSMADLEELPELLRRKPGCVSARRRLAEARVGAQSPLETRVRLRASDGGLPPDELQVPIHDEVGILLGYADLGYRLPGGRWLIVEADGQSVHELPEALLHDRRRQNEFLSGRVASVIRFAWPDTATDAYIPTVLRKALSSAGWRP